MKYVKGQILSEINYYKVDSLLPDGNVSLVTDNGDKVTISPDYLDNYTNSGDVFEVEEEKTMTELSEIVLANARLAMTVAFYKKDQEKGKKAFDAEKKAKIDEIQSASLKTAADLLNDLIENPITRTIKGELRVLKGRHNGHLDQLGRIHFIDMDISIDSSKDYDVRKREIDTRTIQSVIVNKVKYKLKK
jgi:hypothetical protein